MEDDSLYFNRILYSSRDEAETPVAQKADPKAKSVYSARKKYYSNLALYCVDHIYFIESNPIDKKRTRGMRT